MTFVGTCSASESQREPAKGFLGVTRRVLSQSFAMGKAVVVVLEHRVFLSCNSWLSWCSFPIRKFKKVSGLKRGSPLVN
jgi:hypothetical protein